jgi:Putative bacterial sensory transduction regulator
MNLMTSERRTETLSATLIERYLRTRGSRYFRGQHDGEYFYVANTRPRRLHVHLEISAAQHNVLVIRVAPSCFFPAADRPFLMHVADTWNQQDREVTAVLQESSDPERIGITVRRSQCVQGRVDFDDFATFVDCTIAAAIEFFGELTPVTECPSTAPPLLQDAG